MAAAVVKSAVTMARSHHLRLRGREITTKGQSSITVRRGGPAGLSPPFLFTAATVKPLTLSRRHQRLPETRIWILLHK